MSILSILKINKDHSNPYFPIFLSYHDSGIGLTPYEKKVKGFNTFMEKMLIPFGLGFEF
jgi:hypothetical protein